MFDKRFGQLRTDGQNRIKRGHRVLKDHAQLVAAQGARLSLRQLQQIASAEPGFTGDDLSGRRRNDTHDRAGGHCFAATGFTDDSDDFAGCQREINAAQGLYSPCVGAEMDM